MTVKSANADRPWTDYTVTNRLSGKTYRVTLRDLNQGIRSAPVPTIARTRLARASMS